MSEEYLCLIVGMILLRLSPYGQSKADKIVFAVTGVGLLVVAVISGFVEERTLIRYIGLAISAILLLGGVPGVRILLPDNMKGRLIMEFFLLIIALVVLGKLIG